MSKPLGIFWLAVIFILGMGGCTREPVLPPEQVTVAVRGRG